MPWVKICMYIYIKKKCGRADSCNVSTQELANAFSLTRPTASRYMKELQKKGVLFTNLFANGHQTDTKRTLIYLKDRLLDGACGHQTDTKRTLEDRKKSFIENLRPHLEKYGKDTLNAFYQYWTETNEGGKKMRFEMEKVFEVAKRLAAWKSRELSSFKEEDKLPTGMVLHNSKDKDYKKDLW